MILTASTLSASMVTGYVTMILSVGVILAGVLGLAYLREMQKSKQK
jgi:hypothetical protein